MTVGYVARSYDVDRDGLAAALGLDPDHPGRLSLAQIAARSGRTLPEVEADLRTAIALARASLRLRRPRDRVNADAILSLVPVYGAAGLFAVTLLACFGLPIPAALALLAGRLRRERRSGADPRRAGRAGGCGDRRPGRLLAGDHRRRLGRGEAAPARRLGRDPRPRQALLRALGRLGGVPQPLGGLAARPAGQPRGGQPGDALGAVQSRLAGGEGVWVGGYFALGFLFADSFVALAATLGDLGRALAAAAVALFLGLRLRTLLVRAARDRRRR